MLAVMGIKETKTIDEERKKNVSLNDGAYMTVDLETWTEDSRWISVC